MQLNSLQTTVRTAVHILSCDVGPLLPCVLPHRLDLLAVINNRYCDTAQHCGASTAKGLHKSSHGLLEGHTYFSKTVQQSSETGLSGEFRSERPARITAEERLRVPSQLFSTALH
eukprot:gnl/TRDRNA2_/TRDRNA2_69507_c0_seq1.p1 gnl/TRDRNA2_/TRDRNA2_69507_c0~~gnl/TRDRNA2_/TRDRNA2_69507_c0_seq1.p1  ORF type:complete len:115 (+),score=9.35 gnl/TRDRNA2_/TRDRNA2_69507_c0_seq1:36-380(+)